jgi:1-acyl-sn-glycerol-3-phosphate acyltransferase
LYYFSERTTDLFYLLIKLPIRLALLLFCRDTHVRNRAPLGLSGPLLIVANHPNSFLDAIIIGAHFRQPVYFLARGDAFRKPWQAGLLRLLNMIPVYRITEGKENLYRNEYAFEQCKKILARNGIVLIFIEGISVNSHTLQPFKKGAARIAIESRSNEKLKVLPVGIAYDSLVRFGKTINISIGDTISVSELLPYDEEAKNMRYFNEQLLSNMEDLVHQAERKQITMLQKFLLAIPALIGYMIHMLPYHTINLPVRRKTQGTIFYDSVLFGMLFLFYPFYLLLIGSILCWAGLSWVTIAIVLALHPLLARCTVLYR